MTGLPINPQHYPLAQLRYFQGVNNTAPMKSRKVRYLYSSGFFWANTGLTLEVIQPSGGVSSRGSEGTPSGADGQTARAKLRSKQAPGVGGGKHQMHGEAADQNPARSA